MIVRLRSIFFYFQFKLIFLDSLEIYLRDVLEQHKKKRPFNILHFHRDYSLFFFLLLLLEYCFKQTARQIRFQNNNLCNLWLLIQIQFILIVSGAGVCVCVFVCCFFFRWCCCVLLVAYLQIDIGVIEFIMCTESLLHSSYVYNIDFMIWEKQLNFNAIWRLRWNWAIFR